MGGLAFEQESHRSTSLFRRRRTREGPEFEAAIDAVTRLSMTANREEANRYLVACEELWGNFDRSDGGGRLPENDRAGMIHIFLISLFASEGQYVAAATGKEVDWAIAAMSALWKQFFANEHPLDEESSLHQDPPMVAALKVRGLADAIVTNIESDGGGPE